MCCDGAGTLSEAWVSDTELLCERLDKVLWNIGRVGEERAEEAQRAKLYRQSQPQQRISSGGLQELEVGWLQREELPELLGRGVIVEATVALEMIVGQKFKRHTSPETSRAASTHFRQKRLFTLYKP